MNTHEPTPAMAIHPGEHLLDELEARGLNQQALADMIGKKRSYVNELIKGKRDFNTEVAVLIGEALEIDADFWISLQKNYELDRVRLDQKVQERKSAIETWNRLVKGNVPVNFLKKAGYISGDPVQDIPSIKNIYSIQSLDGLGSVYANYQTRFRKSEKLVVDEVNLVGWVKLVEFQARQQIVIPFDHSSKESAIQELRAAINRNQNLKEEVRSILASYGIKLVYLDKPEKVPVDGVSFWSDGSPAIGMTLRHNRIDNFAFTLFHELGHVYLHLVNNNQAEYITWRERSGATDSKSEKEADDFARNHLINKEDWDRFNLSPSLGDDDIINFAEEVQSHPAIVRGRVCYEYNHYARKTSISYSIN